MSSEGFCALVEGALGGGKTLYVVERVALHLARGGTAVTNIPMLLPEVEKCLAQKFRVVFDPARLRLIDVADMRSFHDYAVRGTARLPAMYAIDEAAMNLNARDWKKREEMAFHLVLLCRKLRILLYFIAQDIEDMDSQIRRKFNFRVRCRSLSNLFESSDGRQWGIPLFWRVRYSDKLGGRGQEKNTRLGWEIRWRSWAFGLYETHALHGDNARVFESLPTADDTPLKKIPRDTTLDVAYALSVLAAILATL